MQLFRSLFHLDMGRFDMIINPVHHIGLLFDHGSQLAKYRVEVHNRLDYLLNFSLPFLQMDIVIFQGEELLLRPLLVFVDISLIRIKTFNN